MYFVEATPGGQLARQCQSTFRRCGLSVKVVERTGTSLKKLLVKSDFLKKGTCKCMVCVAAGKQVCQVRDCVYEITCTACEQKYIGETSRSLGERFREHMKLLQRRSNASVLRKHLQQNHQDSSNAMGWKLKILARCPGDAALRQATEACYIQENKPELNSKIEYGNANRPSRPVPAARVSVPAVSEH